MVARRGDRGGVAEVGLAVGKVPRVDDVEAAAAVEQDALERQLVLRAEVLHLGRQVDAHAEVSPGRVRLRKRDLAALVEAVEVGHREVEGRDAQPVGEHGAARLGQHVDVGQVDEAQVGRVGRVDEHARRRARRGSRPWRGRARPAGRSARSCRPASGRSDPRASSRGPPIRAPSRRKRRRRPTAPGRRAGSRDARDDSIDSSSYLRVSRSIISTTSWA